MKEWVKKEGWAKIQNAARWVIKTGNTLARVLAASLRGSLVESTTPHDTKKQTRGPKQPNDKTTTTGSMYHKPSTRLRETAKKILPVASSDSLRAAFRKRDLQGLGTIKAEGQVWVNGKARKGNPDGLQGITYIRESVIMSEASSQAHHERRPPKKAQRVSPERHGVHPKEG